MLVGLGLVIGKLALAGEATSLAGPWRFRLDEKKTGVEEKWFAAPLKCDVAIPLPGTIDEAVAARTLTVQGTGKVEARRELEVNVDDPALQAPGLGGVLQPQLLGPRRICEYIGAAWYQRDIEIPAAWAGKRVTLLLERCRWVTTVWVDDRLVGSRDSLVAPHRYDLGTKLQFGRHRLTVCLDNTFKLELGNIMSVFWGSTPGNMNGITGRIEMEATPPVWIDDVQVFPNLAKKSALVKVRIGNATGKAGTGTLSVGETSVPVSWTTDGGKAEAEVDMSGAKLWDEFTPVMSELTVKLGDHARTIRFGMREISTRGRQLVLNGKPVFMRGTTESHGWPVHGYAPTDTGSWRRIFGIIKSYGLNHMRFHSWCPPDAAFAAADEEGIFLQVEGPMANVAGGDREAFLAEEFQRMVESYGNHPSFVLMALGNECSGSDEWVGGQLESLMRDDPRHLYTSSSNGKQATNRQFTVQGSSRGIKGRGTDHDSAEIVAKFPALPYICHEVGQWAVYPDLNEIQKWTGVMRLTNFESVRDDLTKKGLLDLAPQFFKASGRLAALLYKEEIELMFRTPGHAGFQLLGLNDYASQGTALTGILDAFWDSKGCVTPERHCQYCGPVVPLLRIPKRTYAVDESFTGRVEVACFAPGDLKDVIPAWSLRDDAGNEVSHGAFPSMTLPAGAVTPVGLFTATFAKAKAPCKLSVVVSLKGAGYTNDWDIWAYPADEVSVPADVVVARKLADAFSALQDGKKVVLFPNQWNPMLTGGGGFKPVFWSPVWFGAGATMGMLCDPAHPVFAAFPTEFHSNWQWYDLLSKARAFSLKDAPATLTPVIRCIDNFAMNRSLAYMIEARVGKGKLLMCGIPLPDLAKTDVTARQFLRSIYGYVGSDKFKPSSELSATWVEQRCSPLVKSRVRELGARVIAVSSEQDRHPGSNVLDGNLSTIWNSRWAPKKDKLPYYLVIDLGQELTVKGIAYVPPLWTKKGKPSDCEVYIANDEKDLGQPVVSGKLRNSDERETWLFDKPAKGRYLKFVVKAVFDGNKTQCALTELDIIEKE